MTTAVLLPGNMCDARLWDNADGAIRRVIRDAGLALADADCSHDDTIAAMAARALAATRGTLLPVGFSMGGIVALEMARQAPERVAALVLADTNCGADLPERGAARPAQQARVRTGELGRIVADELKPAYLAAAHRGNEALKALLFDMAIRLGAGVFCQQSEALRTRPDLGGVLDHCAKPLLFLVGAEDTLCPPAWHQAMAARAATATLAIIAGAGHMLPLEQPGAFASTLAAWLDHVQLGGTA